MWQMFLSKFSRDWNISQPVSKRRDKVCGDFSDSQRRILLNLNAKYFEIPK